MSRRSALVIALLAVHGALAVTAILAWIEGPFRGRPILDGAEVLAVAQHGGATPFDTKSPLYPWALGLLLRAGAGVPWTTGLFGLATSAAILLGIGALCRRVGAPGAAGWAMALYAVSGSPLVMLTTPLSVLLGTALLLWGVVAIAAPVTAPHTAQAGTRPAQPRSAPRWPAAVGGALLAGSVLAVAALLPAALLAPCAPAARRRWLSIAGGALLAAAAGLLAFGARAWPEGSGLNLRLGNGGARSGTTDVRPGPAYDRLRLEPVFAAYEAGRPQIDADAFQRRELLREIAADPAGAAATLLRKLFLFWHRAEIAADVDFRHGLQTMTLLPVILLAYGLVAPLGLVLLLTRRPPLLLLPVTGVLLANLVYVTSARYRFPTLPFLCAAAGMFLASRPGWRGWAAAALLGLLLNLDLAGRALSWPGDGAAQEGRELLAQRGREAEALAPLQRAAREGSDARARYDLALAYEKLADSTRRPDLLPLAERCYREALALDPLYPQPAENLMSLLIHAGRLDEAVVLGERVVAGNPYSGIARLNLAAARKHMDPSADIRALLIEGHRIAALAALAQNDRERARLHALELARMAAPDERLQRLLDGADR